MTDEQDLARQERLLRYQRDQTLARIHMLQQQINAQQRVNQWWNPPARDLSVIGPSTEKVVAPKPRRLRALYRMIFRL